MPLFLFGFHMLSLLYLYIKISFYTVVFSVIVAVAFAIARLSLAILLDLLTRAICNAMAIAAVSVYVALNSICGYQLSVSVSVSVSVLVLVSVSVLIGKRDIGLLLAIAVASNDDGWKLGMPRCKFVLRLSV